MQVQIYRIDDTLPLPQYETTGSCGFDFIARQDTVIEPGQIGLIPGNVVVKCPEGLALLVLPRSSTYRKTGLTFPHSVGLIDQDYCGAEDEIMIQVHNTGTQAVTVQRGDRIAQGLFINTPKITFTEVGKDFLGQDSRGGFGSTDKFDSLLFYSLKQGYQQLKSQSPLCCTALDQPVIINKIFWQHINFSKNRSQTEKQERLLIINFIEQTLQQGKLISTKKQRGYKLFRIEWPNLTLKKDIGLIVSYSLKDQQYYLLSGFVVHKKRSL